MERRIERRIRTNVLALLFATMAVAHPVKADDLDSQRTTILATGDVMLGRSVNKQIEKEGNDATWPFQQMKGTFQSADITIVNSEAPIIPDSECPDSDVDANLKLCDKESNATAAFKYAGINIANLANNHRYDYGEAGYQSTMAILQKLGVQPSDETHMAVITHNGTKFGFIGFNLIRQSKEMKIPTVDEILDKVKTSKTKVDVLVVSMHWGIEYSHNPASNIIDLAHKIVDNGADLVVGNHPHVEQPDEDYKGKHIVYSEGNFIFDQTAYDTTHAKVEKYTFEGKDLVKTDIVPIKIVNGQPHLDNQ